MIATAEDTAVQGMWRVGQLVRVKHGELKDRLANIKGFDGDGVILLRDVDPRLDDGRRRTVCVSADMIDAFESSTDTVYSNPWSIQERDLVGIGVGRNAAKRGRVYGGPPGHPTLLRVHVAGDRDGEREYVGESLFNLTPITDLDPDLPEPVVEVADPVEPEPEPPAEPKLGAGQKAMRAMVEASEVGRPWPSDRELRHVYQVSPRTAHAVRAIARRGSRELIQRVLDGEVSAEQGAILARSGTTVETDEVTS